MATYRITWSFSAAQGGVWNEVYYIDGSSVATSALISSAVRSARLALLSPNNTWLASRAAQVFTPRVTAISTLGYEGQGPSGGGVGPETVGSCAVINLAGSAGGARKLWMRGLSDADVVFSPTSGQAAPPAGFISRVNTWIKAMVNDGYGLIQVTPRAATGQYANVNILKVDGSAGNGTSIVTLASAPGYPTPSRVIIGGASKKDLPALNGRWQVLAVAGSTITIPYQTPSALISTGGNAHVRLETYGATNVFSYAASGFAYYGTRITKNFNTRSRGARRAQRIRTLE
jgi:hypothetical protein